MIKIVKGTYGHREGKKIIPKTEKDGPFKATPEQEKRLVDLGVAVYVGEPEVEPTIDDTEPKYNLKMKLDKLKEVAKHYGVDASSARSKAKAIEMIEAAIAADDTTDETVDNDSSDEQFVDDGGEAPPVITPADPE